jgi:hypothetical protein
MITMNHLEEQVPFYAQRLKALRRNEDRTLKFSFQFEGVRSGVFSIHIAKDDEPFYGKFSITVDNASNGVRLYMRCSGFYISSALKIERALPFQYSEYKVLLDKELTPLMILNLTTSKRNTMKIKEMQRIPY